MKIEVFIGQEGQDLTSKYLSDPIIDSQGNIMAFFSNIRFEDNRTKADLFIDDSYYKKKFMEVLEHSIFPEE